MIKILLVISATTIQKHHPSTSDYLHTFQHHLRLSTYVLPPSLHLRLSTYILTPPQIIYIHFNTTSDFSLHFTFTFSHLADAFIQSGLQGCVHIFYIYTDGTLHIRSN